MLSWLIRFSLLAASLRSSYKISGLCVIINARNRQNRCVIAQTLTENEQVVTRFSFGLLALWTTTSLVIAQDAASDTTVEQLYQQAEKLAADNQGEQAAEKLKAAIELHLKNDAAFHKSLRALAAYYEATNQPEQGIRELFRLVGDEDVFRTRYEVFRDIVEKYSKKHPDLVREVQAEVQQAAREKRNGPILEPAPDIVDSILQREDEALRDKSLAKLKEMLGRESSVEAKRSALISLQKALPAKFDHKSFYTHVIPLIDSEDIGTRIMVLTVLPAIGGSETDLPAIIKHVDDKSLHVRKVVGTALAQIGKGKHGDLIIPALMKLMEDDEESVVENTIRSQWGQYSSPEYDKFLIELSLEPRHHHNVIYFCLSTMRSKSKSVCERLIDELADPDWNNSGRAAWGLTYGVEEDAKPTVETGLLAALPQETNEYTRKQEMRALAQVATNKSKDYLQSVVDSTLETDEFKNLAREILNDFNR